MPVVTIGKCEECKTLVSILDMTTDGIENPWRCHGCEAVLNDCSFGYDSPSGNNKVRWIGPDGQWHDEPDDKIFLIGSWIVTPPILSPAL